MSCKNSCSCCVRVRVRMWMCVCCVHKFNFVNGYRANVSRVLSHATCNVLRATCCCGSIAKLRRAATASEVAKAESWFFVNHRPARNPTPPSDTPRCGCCFVMSTIYNKFCRFDCCHSKGEKFVQLQFSAFLGFRSFPFYIFSQHVWQHVACVVGQTARMSNLPSVFYLSIYCYLNNLYI